jgi:hypothetical protein
VTALLVVVGTAAVGAAADDEDDSKSNSKQGSSWFNFGNWFGTDKKPADPGPSSRTEGRQAGSTERRQPGGPKRGKTGEKDAVNKEPVVETRPNANDLAVRRRALEQDALLRRQDVCDRLAEVAMQTNNAELANLAEQLKQRAWEVYTRRTANLPTVAQAAGYDLDPTAGNAPGGGAGLPEGRLDGGELPPEPARAGQPLAGRGDYR